MPALAPSKTWQSTYGGSPLQNVLFVTGSNDNKRLLFMIKQMLTGVASSPWVVQKSSDGTANAGAGDFWASDANIVHAAAGVNHSWITMRQTGIGATAEILIDCSNATTTTATILFAPGGFDTGGTLTTAPTASGSSSTLCSNAIYLAGATSFSGRISVFQSTDGECTRVLWCRNGIAEGFWMFEKLAQLPNGILASDFGGSVPFVGYAGGTNGTTMACYPGSGSGGLDGTGSVKPQIIVGSTAGNAGTTNEGVQVRWHGGRFYAQNALDRGYAASPAGVEGITTVGVRGLWGMLQDMWTTTSSFSNDQGRPNLRLGAHMDVAPGDYGLVSVNGLVLPWSAGEPMVLI